MRSSRAMMSFVDSIGMCTALPDPGKWKPFFSFLPQDAHCNLSKWGSSRRGNALHPMQHKILSPGPRITIVALQSLPNQDSKSFNSSSRPKQVRANILWLAKVNTKLLWQLEPCKNIRSGKAAHRCQQTLRLHAEPSSGSELLCTRPIRPRTPACPGRVYLLLTQLLPPLTQPLPSARGSAPPGTRITICHKVGIRLHVHASLGQNYALLNQQTPAGVRQWHLAQYCG